MSITPLPFSVMSFSWQLLEPRSKIRAGSRKKKQAKKKQVALLDVSRSDATLKPPIWWDYNYRYLMQRSIIRALLWCLTQSRRLLQWQWPALVGIRWRELMEMGMTQQKANWVLWVWNLGERHKIEKRPREGGGGMWKVRICHFIGLNDSRPMSLSVISFRILLLLQKRLSKRGTCSLKKFI